MSKTELMDIGQHCSFCGQIDFLPFKCSCKATFCQFHRKPESHQCPDWKLKQEREQREKSKESSLPHENSFKDLPSSQSLFPDRSKWKPPVLKTTETNPTTLGGSLVKQNKSNALNKLKSFFAKRPKSAKTQATTNPSKRIVEIAKLKNQSKGDSKIPTSERIHLWIQVIDEDSNIDRELRNPLFISRGWPIGRALDSLATQLKLKNINNRTNDQEQKLFLFKVVDKDFVKLNTSDRCSSLKDGDNLFIVRGSEH